jgi:hypothetical protein
VVYSNGRIQFKPLADPDIVVNYKAPVVSYMLPALVPTIGESVFLSGENFGWNTSLVLATFTNLKVPRPLSVSGRDSFHIHSTSSPAGARRRAKAVSSWCTTCPTRG